MRLTSSTTHWSRSEIVSQSMYRRLARAWAAADVAEPVGAELGSLEALAEDLPHPFVVEELHAAVRVVDDEPLLRAEQLVRDHQRADRIVAGAAAGVADHVRVSLAQARVLGGIEPRVHAGEDREPAGRWQSELALGSERCGVLLVGGQDLVENGHFQTPFGWRVQHFTCERLIPVISSEQ